MPKRHTPATREDLVALSDAGLSYAEIAKKRGLTRLAVAGVVWRAKNVEKLRGQSYRRPRSFSRNYSVWVEPEMERQIEAQRLAGQNTAQLLRDLLAAGLDAMESD